jgi:hypothetical protein
MANEEEFLCSLLMAYTLPFGSWPFVFEHFSGLQKSLNSLVFLWKMRALSVGILSSCSASPIFEHILQTQNTFQLLLCRTLLCDICAAFWSGGLWMCVLKVGLFEPASSPGSWEDVPSQYWKQKKTEKKRFMGAN